jgi:hypothetical protein
MDRTNDWALLPGMFLRPRRTISTVVANQRHSWVLALAMVGGVCDVLVRTADTRPAPTPASLLLVAAIGGSIGGVLMLYLSSWLVGTSGRWFGGRAPGSALRAALAWGRVPFLAAGLIFLAKLAFFGWGGEARLLDEGTRIGALWTLVVLNVAIDVLAVWSLVSTVAAVSEVQGISAARTVGSFLLAGVIFGLFVFALVFVIAAFRH